MVWNNDGLSLLVLLSEMLHHLAGISHLLRLRKEQNKSVSLLVKDLYEELTFLKVALSTYPH